MWSVVTESPSTASARAPDDVAGRRGSRPRPVEERRPRDVRRRRVPGVAVARRGSAAPASGRRPRRRPRRSAGTAPASTDSAMTERISSADGQMSARKTGEPSAAVPERLGRQVDVDPARQREGDDQRRRREVARPGERVDAALEVAVARQDRRDDQVVRLDGLGDLPRRAARSCRCTSCSRSRPARTRAPRAGPSGRPTRGSRSRPSSPGASEVLTVGPTRRPRATAFRARRPAPTMTVGFDVFVQEVIAAIATDPVADVDLLPADLDRHAAVGAVVDRGPRRRGPVPRAGPGAGGSRRPTRTRAGRRRGTIRPKPRPRPRRPAPRPLASAASPRLQAVGEVRPEVVAQQVERHAVLRPARARHRRHDRGEVEGQELIEGRPVARQAPQALGLRVALDEGDLLPVSGRSGAGTRSSRRRSGRASPSPRTRGSCC